MTPLRKRMIEDMHIRNMSEVTVGSYVYEVFRFAKYYDKSPEELGAEEVREYLVYLSEERKLSAGRFGVVSAALRFVYKVSLGREHMLEHIPYPKREKKLPVVLSPDEVAALIKAGKTLRDRTIIAVLYGTGVRVSELTHLQVSDIDSKQMVIRIRCGKGRKERLVMLSPQLLAAPHIK